MHDAVMVDGDGNSLDANADGYVDIGGTDFDGTGTVSASVVGSFTIGSGGDYESWPASLSFLPGDTISLSGDLTSDVDAGAYNGTEAAPIVLLGNGHTLTGAHSFGDWWVLYQLTIDGSYSAGGHANLSRIYVIP